ncbi:DUF4962 domain-containing protein [Cellulophaga baltica]|uniref:DUF4962 domain-containing protein n=1 Tax=Cellulophaga TaxID=104264 RepID=UPI001C0688A6|nr:MULTISPECIES: DUF4962 domain-containing protein [Cellulophaga]MBU2996450.1 DUF4962 domain-containing protein [Cellulophaga baltica]MDO6767844.1 DUF4962 domain-containing protein [Cellulophaga sp. 1_MG-2023]
MYFKTTFFTVFLLLITLQLSFSQDTQELEAENAINENLKGESVLVGLMKTKNSSLKKELKGIHPRVFLTQEEIDNLKDKTKSQKELWQIALANVRAMSIEPAPAPAQARRVQNPVGLGIAEAALAYKITGEKKYLEAAKKYMNTAMSYKVWGYEYNKPDVDLAAGHLLYGLGWGYDLLYHDLTVEEREKYKAKLIRQANLLYEFYKPKSGKTYAYSQNHTFIPMAGLAVTAYALAGEANDAKKWAALPRAIYEGVLATYSDDGFYYEGVEYWIFSTPWLMHYLDAHLHATGEDLYAKAPGFKLIHKYIAHATLPGADSHFDYGDTYTGNQTRSKISKDYGRERIDGHFKTSYNILYKLASKFNIPDAQGVADWLKKKGQVNAEEMWTFIWYNPEIASTPIEEQEKWHYFKDHDVVFWRSSWGDDATAFSFKCGPSEGHSVLKKQVSFPEWRLSSGHAHPDAGSFIIWADGKYLTGDSGYEGLTVTQSHNTLVFDGKGQNNEGEGHDVFYGIPYERINKIKITDVQMTAKKVSIIADATAAYEPEVGVNRFIRKFEFQAPGNFTITDDVETNTPKMVTSFLHADNTIKKISENTFEFEPSGTSLMVTIVAPKKFSTAIEENILTAPGDPGSVDKGGLQERGKKLAISTSEKVSKATFITKLAIQKVE